MPALGVKRRWGDKTPFYTPDIHLLWQLFPGCKFIHLVRDGRDVAVSQKNISWLPGSVARIAEEWRYKTTVCHKVGSVLPRNHFLEIKYESLVGSTETTLARVCDFLDEPFDEAMLRYDESAKTVVPEVSLQWHQSSVQAPDPSKIGVWKEKLSR